MDGLIKHSATINKLLARYGVKFGIYKNGEFKEQLFPFDPIPRVIAHEEFMYLERGLKQRVDALNCFLRDIYGKKQIVRDGVVPEEFVFSAKGYLPPCDGFLPPKGIYSHISGIDLVQSKNDSWYILEDNLRVPSGASYPMIAREFQRKSAPEAFLHNRVIDNRNYAQMLRSVMDNVNTGGINVILSPGRYNAAFFKHSYLAERTSAVLTTGSDLVCENDTLYYVDYEGRKRRVGAVYRRISDEYLDPMTFGEGEKSVCIVGATRGNEVQQVYICSQLIRILTQLEQRGRICPGKSILVIPTINSHSMNIGKRFWSTDNTDINRMFPGYNLGETTQRIAAGVFDHIHDYRFGIQFTSFYMPGSFIPHVRMMKTGFEDVQKAKDFGLPYIYRRDPKPYDTTTLNYNWQIWNTKAFSLYTDATDRIEPASAREVIEAVLRFLGKNGILQYPSQGGYAAQLIEGTGLVNIKSGAAGIFLRKAEVNARVKKGDTLAQIMDPYLGTVIEEITAPVDGIVFFHASQPIIYSHTSLFRMIPTEET